ncbi:MAG: tyrosine-type recombinase/integrase, partial [Firmicutes bacterium]|nr:tyrosine-type recombinase/integrase [Bacillota bacterium]
YKSGEYKKLSGSKQTAYNIAWNRLHPLKDARVDTLTIDVLRTVVSSASSSYYTARDCKSLLSNLFKLAAADGFANRDLPSFIILPELNEKERTPFSSKEQAALWRLYEGGDKRASIPLLMIYTGMMPGEAMALRAENVDLEHRVILHSGLKTKVRKATPIVIADAILPILEDLLASEPSGHLYKRNKDNWYLDYYAALEAAGCRKLTPYSCRHTTATALAVTENVAPQTIRRIMRWSTTRMLDRYAHPQTSDALSGINQLKKASDPPDAAGSAVGS